MSEESTAPDPIKFERQAFGTANRHNLDAIMSFVALHAVCDRSASELIGSGVAPRVAGR
jgi:hypothetical protein